MNQMSKSFKKWCLPSKSLGIREDSTVPDINEKINTIIQFLRTHKDEKNKEIPDNIKVEIRLLLIARGVHFMCCYKTIQEQLQDSTDGSDSDSTNDNSDEEKEVYNLHFERDLPVKWDGYQAKTMVSHMIYSQKNGEPKRKLDHSPLMYVLENPRTGRGENVVQVYRGVNTETREYHLPMQMIWDNVKEFMELDSGEFVAETLRDHEDKSVMSEEGHYAQEQMIKLKNVMSTAVLQEHNTGRFLGVQYKGDMLNSLNFLYDGGEVVMNVCDGIPDFGDLNPLLYPQDIRTIVSAVLQKWKDSSPGLFVSIIWKSTDGETGEHYMYMSEYQHAKLHATIAKGFVHNWLSVDPTGKPLFEEHQVAIDSKKKRVQKQHNTWLVPTPLNTYDVMYDMINFLSHDENSGFMKHILEEIFTNANTTPLQRMIRPYFFSGDNLTFCVILFNTTYDFIRDLLDLDFTDSANPWYAVTLVVRYPALDLNIEKVMINLRYKYFMRYSPNQSKWNEWRDGKWHIPGDIPWQDPQEFQEKADPDDPLDVVVERDSKGNIVYPLRYLFHLPPNMTYDSLQSRKRHISLDFFVNNIDEDPIVIYRLPNESEVVWDDIQLFRINAETTVSRIGYERHNQSFFTFRTDEIRQGARGHPFKAYLEKYPDLQPEWRDLWLERYNNMDGWSRLGALEPRNTENRGGRQHNQQQQRQRNRPQGRHQAQGRRQQHRANGQGQAQGRRARRRERDNNNGFRPRQGQILSWQMNPKRALSERKQNEKYLVHMKYDSVKTQ